MRSLLRYLKARELELNLQVRKVQDILHRKVKRRGEEKIPIIRVEHQELDLRQEQTQTVQNNSNTQDILSLPNTVNPQLIQSAANSFMKNNNVSNTVKPIENPLFM